MKLKDAKQELAKLNMTITHDRIAQEYRVTFARNTPGYESAERRDAVAYFTDDIDDAVGTARMMYGQHHAVVNASERNARTYH